MAVRGGDGAEAGRATRAESGAFSGAALSGAALELLAALDPRQRQAARFGFDDDERRRWEYRPRPRRGVRLADLTAAQRLLAHRLVQRAVGRHAYSQVAAIMALEDVLDALERHARARHSGEYYLSVFGEPGSEPWGWRFEGHHVSLNVTVAGRTAATPLFLGANPAVSAIAPLADEEALGRALARAAPAAVLDGPAPDDILSGSAPRWTAPLEPLGARGDELDEGARQVLEALVARYASRSPFLDVPPAAELHFAWVGSVEPGEGHYYRLQGERFLVEYDNTQNGANHIHTVCRNPQGDFGDDLLRQHLEEDHER